MSEFGLCHRNEASGSLNGLFRLRSFNQDDGHVFCRKEHIESELISFINMLYEIYSKFGFNKDDLSINIALRPENKLGDDSLWDQSEKSPNSGAKESPGFIYGARRNLRPLYFLFIYFVDYLFDICIIDFMIKSISTYKSNKNIKYSCQYHIIWCTKYRRDLLIGDVELDLKKIIQDLAIEKNVEIIEMEVMPDHIHLLIDVDPQYGPHLFIKNAKGRSSKFLRNNYKNCKSRVPTLWTNSYFISTIGGVSLDVVKTYIEDQKNV